MPGLLFYTENQLIVIFTHTFTHIFSTNDFDTPRRPEDLRGANVGSIDSISVILHSLIHQ